ncbi:High mobility group B protein [Actinidia chinensis var. chinensis]|uniref:High mobility group B protein n=1 Tax=Actinidia chinensis var. chinensis TaxID=1590841 RepID=A0A2R6QN33_ACTCC|nr:High mobility group B protein [Actinidia chinensis var. chinensis]
MADTAMAVDPVPAKKGRTRKALKQKNPSPNEANILASQTSPTIIATLEDSAGKENHESLSHPKKTKAASKKAKQQPPKQSQSFEKELEEMQEKLQKLRLEKEQTEDLLKARDETLKLKEEEIEKQGREQEKLQMELKKLQKMKEFKPTMIFPMVQHKDQENKEKKKKGCSQMKRPSPPYILWCKDQWNEAKKANPNAEFKDISIILGAKWKTVNAEEKKPYEEKYQSEKEAYLKVIGNEKRENEAMKLLEEEQKQRTAMELLDQYLQFKQEAEETDNKKKKKEKDPLKPKQPMSAFFVFASERRGALLAENKSVLEVAKIAGEEWKNMTEKQRRPYEQRAKQNKEKYVEEMEAYNQKKDEEAENIKKEEEELMKIHKQEAMQLLRKKEKTDNIIKKTKEKKKKKKNADPNKPKKPASSFLLFSKEIRKNTMEEKPGINNSALNALISVKWKEMSEVEKQKWNVRAAEAMEAYKKQLEEYNKSAAAAAMKETN